MPDEGPIKKVSIVPGVTVLSVLRHLNYQPWYAMAEFVDNALQSYLMHQEALRAVEGDGFRLRVDITVDASSASYIRIHDNAAGIQESDYKRAFRPAAVPDDCSGLSEFGMGMKSAACWFANCWQVDTTALGESWRRTVPMDVNAVVRDGIEELDVKTAPADAVDHMTDLLLWDLHKIPHGRTVGKIKDHLASIYRIFIRDGQLDLVFNNDLLTHVKPAVLHAPSYKSPKSDPVRWEKPIRMDLGGDYVVTGFAALRATGSTREAGFALFRRNRLIQGSGEDSYRPEAIFRHSNSFTYQRLFGELHLEGFEVSHTKDGFRWEEHEELFLELLRAELEKGDLPLLAQAEGYRAYQDPVQRRRGAEVATSRTATTIQAELAPVYETLRHEVPDEHRPPEKLPKHALATQREVHVRMGDTPWIIVLELTDDALTEDWVSIADDLVLGRTSADGETRFLGVRMSLAHPFMERFGGFDADRIEPLLRVAVALALAETAARDAGVRMVGTVRIWVNTLLRDALSKP